MRWIAQTNIAGLPPRDDKGRFLALFCNDLNCCGVLMLDSWFGQPVWQCDGLTYDRADGPLRPCTRIYPALAAAKDIQP